MPLLILLVACYAAVGVRHGLVLLTNATGRRTPALVFAAFIVGMAWLPTAILAYHIAARNRRRAKGGAIFRCNSCQEKIRIPAATEDLGEIRCVCGAFYYGDHEFGFSNARGPLPAWDPDE